MGALQNLSPFFEKKIKKKNHNHLLVPVGYVCVSEIVLHGYLGLEVSILC